MTDVDPSTAGWNSPTDPFAEDLLNENRSLRTELERTESALASAVAENEALRRDVATYEAECEKLNRTIEGVAESYGDASGQLTSARRSIEGLRARMTAAETELESVRALLWPDGGARRVPQQRTDGFAAAVDWLLTQRASLTMALDKAEERIANHVEQFGLNADQIHRLQRELAQARNERDRSERMREEAQSVLDQALRATDRSTTVAAWVQRDEAIAQRDEARAEVEALKGARLLSVLFGHHEGAPKPFALQRRRGRDLVALGAEFPDGAVALRLANDGGWTTVSTGGAVQFADANTEILWLSDELEPLAVMESERDRLRTAVLRLLDLYDSGSVLGTIAAIPGLREALDGGT